MTTPTRDELLTALQFYADPRRYSGPNKRLEEPDAFTPADDPYLRDVTRDAGQIARTALLSAHQAQAEPKSCPYCDGTGDVHDATGEWRGRCNCGTQAQAEPGGVDGRG